MIGFSEKLFRTFRDPSRMFDSAFNSHFFPDKENSSAISFLGS